jgi:hypothetical protein
MSVRSTRRQHRTARAALAVAVLGMIASVLALVPADPAHAVNSNPVLFVGGHGNTNTQLEQWADYIDDKLGLPPVSMDDMVRGLQLRSEAGLWPGTASNEVSAWDPGGAMDDVYDAILDLSGDYSNKPVEVIAVSQGALVVRWLLQMNPNNIRSRVASYISFSGVNAGIPDFLSPLDWCEDFDFAVCEQMVWDTPFQGMGETEWLLYNVNNRLPVVGDPTPGSLPYYHVYTTNDDGATDIPDYLGQEIEALKPYGWSVPLLGATNRSAQDECGSGYVAPHGGWTGTTPNLVMEDLLLDALYRRTLDAPSGLC